MVTHFTTRLMIMAAFAGTALLSVTWFSWEDAYSRKMSVVALWVPMVVAVWILCTASLLSAGKGALASALFVVLPVTGVLFSIVFLGLASVGVLGLLGVITLLAVFDLGIILVLHELSGRDPQGVA